MSDPKGQPGTADDKQPEEKWCLALKKWGGYILVFAIVNLERSHISP